MLSLPAVIPQPCIRVEECRSTESLMLAEDLHGMEAQAKHDAGLLFLQGVIVYFRVVDGELKPGDTIRLINTGKEYEVDEVGVLSPKQIPVRLSASLSTPSVLTLHAKLSSIHRPTLVALPALLQGIHQLRRAGPHTLVPCCRWTGCTQARWATWQPP